MAELFKYLGWNGNEYMEYITYVKENFDEIMICTLKKMENLLENYLMIDFQFGKISILYNIIMEETLEKIKLSKFY